MPGMVEEAGQQRRTVHDPKHLLDQTWFVERGKGDTNSESW